MHEPATRQGRRRSLHHAILAVSSLEDAREWFERLGFIVAPNAVHPFGTENACVFLPDGTYIELLAVAHRETCEAEARAGNAFAARDQAHRFRVGVPSFAGAAFASTDAESDRVGLQQAGFGAGEMLAFERRFEMPGGGERMLGFRLAFARDLRAPDISFFTCEQTHAEAPDRSALIVHRNGTVGTARLVLAEPNPSDFQYYLQHLTGDREGEAGSFGMTLRAGAAVVEVASPEALAMRYGGRRDDRRGLSFEEIVLAVRELPVARRFAEAAGLACEERQGRIIVRFGAKAFLAFEEIVA